MVSKFDGYITVLDISQGSWPKGGDIIFGCHGSLEVSFLVPI